MTGMKYEDIALASKHDGNSLFSGKKPNKFTPRGQGGSPKFCFTPNLIFFVTCNPCKIWEPYDNSSGRKVTQKERREKKRKNAVNSGH